MYKKIKENQIDYPWSNDNHWNTGFWLGTGNASLIYIFESLIIKHENAIKNEREDTNRTF